jgi:hypothetical protein
MVPLVSNTPSGRKKYRSRDESDPAGPWVEYRRLWIGFGRWIGSEVTDGDFFEIVNPRIRQVASVAE